MNDIWVVTRKEFREQLRRRGDVFRYTWFAIIFGGILPVINVVNGREVLTVVSLPWLAYAGVFIASGATLGAFFTERQRGTLESLLATPLSDRAIFTGKVIFSLFISIFSVVCAIAIELAVVNAALRVAPYLQPGFGGSTFGFPPVIFFGLLVTLPTVLLYTISTGTLISLRVANIRTANLYNMLSVLPLALPFGILSLFVPAGITWPFLIALTGAMLVIDTLMMWTAIRLFSRETAVLNVPG